MELGLLQVWHNSRLTMFRYVTYNKKSIQVCGRVRDRSEMTDNANVPAGGAERYQKVRGMRFEALFRN